MLPVAKILKSNGTDGELLLGLLDVTAEDLNLTEPVFIEFDGLPVPFFIESIQAKGSTRALVHLTDIDSLRDAEEVVGRMLSIQGEWEEESESDFVGWTIYDRDRLVGTVTGIEPIPGNLCLYIGEDLIPLHEDLILSADPERRELVLDLPAGLI